MDVLEERDFVILKCISDGYLVLQGPQGLMKSRSRDIRVLPFPIALKFDRHLGSNAAEMRIKFQNYERFNIQSRWLEISRDLAIRRLTA